MGRQGRTALAGAAAVAVLLIPAASAGAGPTAKASGEELVGYYTDGKIKAAKAMRYQIFCGAPATAFCEMSASTKLVVKGGRNAGPLSSSGVFSGGTAVEVTFKVNKRAKRFIRRNIKRVKLRTEISATNLTTGEVDTDSETFKLKK